MIDSCEDKHEEKKNPINYENIYNYKNSINENEGSNPKIYKNYWPKIVPFLLKNLTRSVQKHTNFHYSLADT